MSIDIRLFRLRNCFLNKGKQESDQMHNKQVHLCDSSAKIERITLLRTKYQIFNARIFIWRVANTLFSQKTN